MYSLVLPSLSLTFSLSWTYSTIYKEHRWWRKPWNEKKTWSRIDYFFKGRKKHKNKSEGFLLLYLGMPCGTEAETTHQKSQTQDSQTMCPMFANLKKIYSSHVRVHSKVFRYGHSSTEHRQGNYDSNKDSRPMLSNRYIYATTGRAGYRRH